MTSSARPNDRSATPSRVRDGVTSEERDRIHELEEARIARALAQPSGIDTAEDGDRIVPRQVPQRIVDLLENTSRLALPAPGQVGGDVGKSFNPFGEERESISVNGHGAGKLNCQEAGSRKQGTARNG